MKFEGAMASLVTPDRLERDELEALARLVEHCIENGVDGFVLFADEDGLAIDARVEVAARVVAQSASRVPLLAAADSPAAAEAMRSVGAAGVLVDADDTDEGWGGIGLPVVLTNRSRSIDQLGRLAQSDDTDVVGVLETSSDLAVASATIAACGDALPVLASDDHAAFGLLSLGANGFVSRIATLAPRLVADLADACVEARWTDARQIHYQLFGLAQALRLTSPERARAALALLGFGGDATLAGLDDEARVGIESALGQHGLLPRGQTR